MKKWWRILKLLQQFVWEVPNSLQPALNQLQAYRSQLHWPLYLGTTSGHWNQQEKTKSKSFFPTLPWNQMLRISSKYPVKYSMKRFFYITVLLNSSHKPLYSTVIVHMKIMYWNWKPLPFHSYRFGVFLVFSLLGFFCAFWGWLVSCSAGVFWVFFYSPSSSRKRYVTME